jgi:hypothetical protein
LDLHLSADPSTSAVTIIPTALHAQTLFGITVEACLALTIFLATKDAVTGGEVAVLIQPASTDPAPLPALVWIRTGIAKVERIALRVVSALCRDAFEGLRVTAEKGVFIPTIQVFIATLDALQIVEVAAQADGAARRGSTSFDAIGRVSGTDLPIETVGIVRTITLFNVCIRDVLGILLSVLFFDVLPVFDHHVFIFDVDGHLDPDVFLIIIRGLRTDASRAAVGTLCAGVGADLIDLRGLRTCNHEEDREGDDF